jgi:glucose/arabinose dehydrogenase
MKHRPHCTPRSRLALLALPALIAACGEKARLPDGADAGPAPQLTQPRTAFVPTVDIAPAVGWSSGQAPVAAEGLTVRAFAQGLEHPRWLHVLPNGDVLVAETNAPERPDEGKGVKGWVMKKVMARAGAGVKSPDRITLLRDADGDGVAEVRSVFLQKLNAPFGMALVGDRLYIANTDAVVELPYADGDMTAKRAPQRLTDLPAGTRNHHWTKALIASPDGTKLYATVGSNSNVAENGMAEEDGRAAIWEIDRASGTKRLFGTGLRNPNGMAWSNGVLWTVVNERDELGSDLVPDYLTSVREGAFYGWPYSWYGSHVDPRVEPKQPELVAKAVMPDYALGSHVAPLGLAAAPRGALTAALEGAPAGATAAVPAAAGSSGAGAAATGTTAAGAAAAAAPGSSTAGAAGAAGSTAAGSAPSATWNAAAVEGMFVGLHGSWNRKPLSGYKVVYVDFDGGKPKGPMRDVLTGFVNAQGDAMGRPVGVAIDQRGGLLVADDVGNTIWRVAPR